MVLKVSIAGIRGDVNVGLTPEVILNMSLAYGTYMKKGTIIIGSDTRP
ncbi:phosphoglucosamine mutase, partial [Candidatus Calescamantes bacterium]|nr:phosphoglucosamine mutase [Candidatus Calescamantes bacterium]